MIGYNCEEIEDERDSNNESLTNSAEIEFHSTVDEDESLVAPGYIRDVCTSVKPMTYKHMSNILSTVKDTYNSCDSDMQFELGDLCLKMQEMLMSHRRGSLVVASNHHKAFFLPAGSERVSESKKLFDDGKRES